MRTALITPSRSYRGLGFCLVLACSGSVFAEERPTVPAANVTVDVVATAATEPPLGVSRWGIGASWVRYTESLMQIAGPALGLRADRPFQAAERPWALEGEVWLGRADYTSPVSGNIDGVLRLGSAFFLHPVGRPAAAWIPRPEAGLTTEWTDLRGLSTSGKAGYERFNLSLWLGGSWEIAPAQQSNAIQLRAALLLTGWQRSMLAQAGSQYQNVTNTQRRGVLVSLEQPWALGETRASLRLQLRGVERSNFVSAGTSTVYEPANRSAELSVTFWQ